ncbi:CAT1, partial [Symbiodinium pilosum]
VGGFHHAQLAKQLGFEAFRTWGLDQLRWVLKDAASTGFKVMVGIDMTRDPQYYKGDEHCDDLEGSSFWQKEAKRILERVDQSKYDEHILMWLVGNELETPIDAEKGSDCLWRRVNWMAGKIKEVDPNHPTGIALAGIATPKVAKMAKLCPKIDVLGTNLYGNAIRDVGARLRAAGWRKPWAFTECGPLGPWEVPRTSWGAVLEQSSTDKGQFLKRGLRLCMDDEMCVGFMAFLWGWKWEKTGTWFGLMDSWHEANGYGYLNDMGQPLYDIFGPKDKTAFRIHIDKLLVAGGREVPLGFSAHRGAEVQLDLFAIATAFPGDTGAWASWAVTKETPINPESDGNIAEKQLPVIKDVVEACPNSFRAKLKTWELEEGGSYRLYAFARRIHHGGLPGYPPIVEASISVPFHIGPQNCSDVESGTCFEEATRVMNSARRMGHADWPAAGLLPTSTFKEFQAALHVQRQAGCPAPCSVDVGVNSSSTCIAATQLRYVVDVPAAQKLLEPPEITFSGECSTAQPPEECFYGTKWLLDTGRYSMPEAFPEVTITSTFEDAQLALWKRAKNHCKRPCPDATQAAFYK